MKNKTEFNYDLPDFLLDDEFVRKIKDGSHSDEYIAGLKAQFPTQERNIDLAIQVLETIENKQIFSTQEQRRKVWFEIVSSLSKSENINNISLNIRTNTPFIRIVLRVAAVMILLLGIGTLAFYYTGIKNVDDSPIIRFASSNQVDYTKAQLILSDGKKIEVASVDAKIRYSPDGTSVTINDTSGIVQDVRNEKFNQMIVAYGKYATLQLSDGTKVWLNAGSRLVYPPTFTGKYREVYLQGEGYFEVTKDVTRPFHVKTDRLKVEVLGTKFDVQAYSVEDTYSALLLEGKISLSSPQNTKMAGEQVVLKQSEWGVYSDNTNSFVVKKINHPENLIAWTYGYINFNDEPLESLLKRISRYYNIEIQLRSDMGSFKISGKLDLKDDPERVLRGLAIISKMKLSKKEGGYLIKD
ncbi:MAG: FecR domain-containing protein [Mariniphaga sp.]